MKRKTHSKNSQQHMLSQRVRDKATMRNIYEKKDVPLSIIKFFRQRKKLHLMKDFLDCMSSIVIKFCDDDNKSKNGVIKKYKFVALTLKL